MSILVKALNKNNLNYPKTLTYNGKVLFCMSSQRPYCSFLQHSVMTEDFEKLSMKSVLNMNIYIIFKFKSNSWSSKQLQKLKKKNTQIVWTTERLATLIFGYVVPSAGQML